MYPSPKRARTSTFVNHQNNIDNNSNNQNKNGMGSNGHDIEVDEGLYSRQLFVLGKDGMQRMSKTNILISGLSGPGLEAAKNIILAGCNSVSLHDPHPITWTDLSSCFFAEPTDLGKIKADVFLPKLAELNNNVKVQVIKDAQLSHEVIKRHTVLVLSQATNEACSKLGDLCHEANVKFVVARTQGIFGTVFCDFGDEFIVTDATGTEPPSVMIQQIEKSEEGLVTCLEETRHNFQDGDYVVFSEVKGMVELNNHSKPRKISIAGPDAFKIGNTCDLSSYISGGICTVHKMPQKLSFKSFRDAYVKPDFVITDFAKIDHMIQLHMCFKALDNYIIKHKSYPRSWNVKDAEEFILLVEDVASHLKTEGAECADVDPKLCSLFAYTCRGECCPIQSIIGGFAAQEALKACTLKFIPLQQWLYFDATETLPSDIPEKDNSCSAVIAEGDASAVEDRYDGQVAIYGRKFQEKLKSLKYLMVGAGAIGCELLKNFALMGVCAGPKGKLFLTDMDSIEKSNLNRQFLFRPWDISKMKSTVAASAAKRMNSEINIDARNDRIGAETESIYNDAFFESLDGVANALDNIEARTYVDRRCVYYRKSLLESGTLGMQCNVQVVIPDLTESYSSSHDPPEKSFAICTLKNFPYLIEHTLQWARDLFEGTFVQESQSLDSFVRDPSGFIDRTIQTSGNQSLEILQSLANNIITERPKNIEDCVIYARLFWQRLYYNMISQLLFNFPPAHVTTSGAPFWSGTKRCPSLIAFDVDNETHTTFVEAAANLRARMFNIPECRDHEKLKAMITAVKVPVFQPKSGVAIEITDAEVTARAGAPITDTSRLDDLRAQLLKAKDSNLSVNVIEFEKDDDTNFHMDFIAAASNSRADCYSIANADRLKSKQIAGRILPAIATTTSIVAGLVCLELYKLVQGHKALESYKNCFFDLAQPFMASYEPVAAPKSKYNDTEFTLWDRFEFQGPMTFQQLLDYFQEKHKLEVTMVSQDVLLLFAFFMSGEKRKLRLNTPIEQAVEEVSKRKIPSHVSALVIEVCCQNEAGDDVDVPYIRYKLPPSS